ncbi:HEAT repeat domain-containing protein [Haloarcula sp. AONF1]
MREYDPNRYVSDLWREELTDAGISQHRADQIRQLTFGDPKLSLDNPSSEDVLRVVIEAIEQFDFESAIDADAEVDADELRERLVETTYAGLRGRLLGPAAGPSDVALDNDGISTVDLEDIDWTPPGEEADPEAGTKGYFQNLNPEEVEQAMTGVEGHHSKINVEEHEHVIDRLTNVVETDSSTEVRVAALEALGTVVGRTDRHRESVVSFLYDKLESDEAAVRAAAATALGQAIGASSPSDDGEEDEDSSEPRSADPFS